MIGHKIGTLVRSIIRKYKKEFVMNNINIWFPAFQFPPNAWVIALIATGIFCGTILYVIEHTTKDENEDGNEK